MRTLPKLVMYCAIFGAFANPLAGCKTRGGAASLKDDESTPTLANVEATAPRLEAASPWYWVAEDDVDLHMSYSGFRPDGDSTTEGERFRRLAIGKKGLDMIEKAKTTIVASTFLFDSMYATDPESTAQVREESSPDVEEARKITQVFRDALLKKKKENPDMLIAVVLDPINRSYVDRVSEAVQRFQEAGIDVFYSDLASTPAVGVNNVVMQKFQELHRNDVHVEDLQADALKAIEGAVNDAAALNPLLGGKLAPVQEQLQALKQGKPLMVGGQPLVLDGQPVTLELLYNVALLKANHRKLLATDDGAGGHEALISSANPHNASFGAANSALSIKGAPARYVYNVIREDVRWSIERQKKVEAKYVGKPELAQRYGKRFALWGAKRQDAASRADYLKTVFPPLDEGMPGAQSETTPASVSFVTESKIGEAVIELLKGVEKGDEVRIQMFYLSYPPVIEAILEAAKRVEKPLRLILDPNKDAFNKIKDGTPNRQVARYILAEKAKPGSGINLELRWYSTHGEQNHAKIMSITNAATGKYQVVTGSGNWTGKNIGGPNMEANLVAKGASRATKKFNDQFDVFWSNTPDAGSSKAVEYTISYDDKRYKYNEQTADDAKWRKGEENGLVSW